MGWAKYVIFGVVAVGAAVAADATALKGQKVFESQVNLVGEQTITLALDQSDKPYSIEITSNGKLVLKWRLLGPRGDTIDEEGEYASHRGTRSFSFYARKSGTHRLVITAGARPYEAKPGSTFGLVRVLANDRRILKPLYHLLGM